MFKIVSTRKKGRVELSTVPASWENKGKLYWPKKNVELLCKNPAILPQPDWNTYNCTLKRNHYKTFEEAEEELSQMLNRTDTDDTDYEQQQDPRVNTSTRISQNNDFNSMAKNLVSSIYSYLLKMYLYPRLHSSHVVIFLGLTTHKIRYSFAKRTRALPLTVCHSRFTPTAPLPLSCILIQRLLKKLLKHYNIRFALCTGTKANFIYYKWSFCFFFDVPIQSENIH